MIDSSQLDGLSADFAVQTAAVPHLMKVVLDKSLNDMAADMQALAPVDTGFLRSSVTLDSTASGPVVAGEVGPTAAYAGYVDGGTSRQAPQPFVEPAADRRVPLFEAALQQLAERL